VYKNDAFLTVQLHIYTNPVPTSCEVLSHSYPSYQEDTEIKKSLSIMVFKLEEKNRGVCLRKSKYYLTDKTGSINISTRMMKSAYSRRIFKTQSTKSYSGHRVRDNTKVSTVHDDVST
jgi:hypothetical protein